VLALFFSAMPNLLAQALAPSVQQQAPSQQAATPKHIVSLTPCLDSLLLTLGEPHQIAALSAQAHDPQAASMAMAARRFPTTAADAEAVLTFKPDLVLASRHTPKATRTALTRAGVRQVLFGVPNTLNEAYAEINLAGQALGGQAPMRAQALITAIAHRIASARKAQTQKPLRRALIYQQGGLVAGSNTLPDALLTAVGVRNGAADYGVTGWGLLPLEVMLAKPPELLLIPNQKGEPRPNRLLGHPALQALGNKTRQIHFPALYIYCGGPVLLSALSTLGSLP
jgi:iron complex transport system substrate-binding protein